MINDGYLNGVVFSDDVDPYKAGAVKVHIPGITDGWDSSLLPYALPLSGATHSVPTKGTNLVIHLEDHGDLNKPRYSFASQNKSALPEEYVNNYPDVAVTNLGDDGFKMVHNRATSSTTWIHPNQSTITWDGVGKMVFDNEQAFGNTGRGAKNNQGNRTQPVLTGGTIDIFTAKAFGASQGSSYFAVPHLDNPQPSNVNTDTIPDDNSVVEPATTRFILDEEIEFIQSSNYTRSVVWKAVKLFITTSNAQDFYSVSKKCADSNSKKSFHYVVGKTYSGLNASSGPSRNADQVAGGVEGLIQTVDLNQQAMSVSNGTYKGKSVDSISISVCLIDGSSTPSLTGYRPNQFQIKTLQNIYKHIKQNVGNISVILINDITIPGLISSGIDMDIAEVAG
jgi:hypothetical protein